MVERFLFVVGDQDSGKSTQLRSMFLDPRFGTQCQVPTTRNVPDTYYLSVDRGLYLRLTSPHEFGETLTEFLDKTEAKTKVGRWAVAGPLQPQGFRNMPDLAATVSGVVQRFQPERVRLCLLSPDRHGQAQARGTLQQLFDQLWSVAGPVECLCIDARDRSRNSSVLAGFLDYT